MPYSEKVHLRNCIIWFGVISLLSVLFSVYSYNTSDFIDYGTKSEFAIGLFVEYFVVLIVYVIPIFTFRFCIRRKPVYTWIAALLISLLYASACSAVEVLVWNFIFGIQFEAVGRFHGLFFPFLLHGGREKLIDNSKEKAILNSKIATEIENKRKSEPVKDLKVSTLVSIKDQVISDQPVLESVQPSEYELQMRQEYKRYRQLREERQKIPANDVKKWHDEGKMTDEQYNKIMSAYNYMGEEMEDIRKRVKILNQTNVYQPHAEENIPKKKEKKKNNKIPVIIAWCSSVLLFICIPFTAWMYQQYLSLEYEYDTLLKVKENISKQRTEYLSDYKDLQKEYKMLVEDRNDLYWENINLRVANKNSANKNIIKIGDSQQTVVEICGSPDKMVEQFKSWGTSDGWKWYYGTSYILFDDFYDTVEAWYIGDTPLPVE